MSLSRTTLTKEVLDPNLQSLEGGMDNGHLAYCVVSFRQQIYHSRYMFFYVMYLTAITFVNSKTGSSRLLQTVPMYSVNMALPEEPNTNGSSGVDFCTSLPTPT